MTIGRARSVLSTLWLCAAFPLFLLFVIQSVLGKYGDEWDMPWNWFIPLTGPILSLIIAVWTIDESFDDQTEVRSLTVFRGTVALSVLYIVCLYAIILVHPFSDQPIQAVFRNSGWYLGIIQGFVMGALGKFFIENVH
jgi:hypothetical protein